MKKFLTVFALLSTSLFAQGNEVTVVGKVVVTPELSVATFTDGFGDITQNQRPGPRPGFDPGGAGYLISPREFIRNIPRTPGQYRVYVTSTKELPEDRSPSSIGRATDFGKFFIIKTLRASTLYLFGLGGIALAPNSDLPWNFRQRVSVPANATHIYIGTIVIRRNQLNDMIGIEVRDEYDQAVIELQAREPGARLVRADLLPFD